MQLFMVLALGVFLTMFGTNEYIKYSNEGAQEYKTNMGAINASNIFIYSDLSYQYILNNYFVFFNPDVAFTNSINYNKTNDFDINTLNNYYKNSYNYTPKYNYNSTYFMYKNNNGVSSIPTIYLLITWNSTNQYDRNLTFTGLNKILNNKKNSGDATYWININFGEYINNQAKLYSLTPQGVDVNKAQTNISNIINNLSSQGFVMGNNFYLAPVYMYN